jgi:hypothetical protein
VAHAAQAALGFIELGARFLRCGIPDQVVAVSQPRPAHRAQVAAPHAALESRLG